MSDLFELFVRAALVENLALSFFLGMCMFLGVSRRIDTAFGFGLAVLAVQTVTVPLNHLLHTTLLEPGAWARLGLPEADLGFLGLATYVGVIAAFVQILELVLERFFPALAASLGVYLPLVTVNCAILGGSLFMVEREYTVVQSAVYGFSSGVGWLLAIASMAAIRKKLRYSHLPDGLKGLGITMIMTGLMAMAFMCFSGINL